MGQDSLGGLYCSVTVILNLQISIRNKKPAQKSPEVNFYYYLTEKEEKSVENNREFLTSVGQDRLGQAGV